MWTARRILFIKVVRGYVNLIPAHVITLPYMGSSVILLVRVGVVGGDSRRLELCNLFVVCNLILTYKIMVMVWEVVVGGGSGRW